MAQRNIKIGLDQIKLAERFLVEYEKALKDKISVLEQKLAEIGKNAAQGMYGSKVAVSAVPIPGGYAVAANGKEVCFLEFGAGLTVHEGHHYASKMPFKVTSGSWSIEHKRMFFFYGYWYCGNKYYDHITPTRAMYKTYVKLTKAVTSAAQEVFV